MLLRLSGLAKAWIQLASHIKPGSHGMGMDGLNLEGKDVEHHPLKTWKTNALSPPEGFNNEDVR